MLITYCQNKKIMFFIILTISNEHKDSFDLIRSGNTYSHLKNCTKQTECMLDICILLYSFVKLTGILSRLAGWAGTKLAQLELSGIIIYLSLCFSQLILKR